MSLQRHHHHAAAGLAGFRRNSGPGSFIAVGQVKPYSIRGHLGLNGGGSLWDLAAGGVGVYRPKSRTIGSEFNLNRSDRICLMSAAAKAQQRMKNGAKPAAAADDDGFPGFGPRQSKSLPDKRHYHRYQSHIEWSNNNNNNNDNDTNASTLRICVLGGKKVGKTALVVRFLTGRFIWEYSQAEKTYLHYLPAEDLMIESVDDDEDDDDEDEAATSNKQDGGIWLEIRDCKGTEERHKPQSTLYHPLPQADGYLLVYSASDSASFTTLDRLLSRVPIAAPCIIVQQKSDLENTIERKALRELAEQWNLSSLSVSALENPSSADSAFVALSKEILAGRKAAEREDPASSQQRRKRKPSQRIFDSFNKMLGQMVHHQNN